MVSINVPSNNNKISITTKVDNSNMSVSLQNVQSFAINKAKDWAEKMDGPIGNEGYSAKWHATICMASEEKAYGYMVETEKIKNDVLLDSGVQTIYSNIEDVKITSENINDIITASDNIEYIKTVLEAVSSSGFIAVRDNLDSIIVDANNIDSINTTASNIETIKELVLLKPNIDKVSENLDSIGINADNISDIVTTAENIEEIKDASVLAGELIDIEEIGLGQEELKNKLNKQQITNCLLEVPQRIKLELNSGVLTLKAGSQVIVPNGFEADGTTPKFDEVTIKGDYSMPTDTGTPDGQHIVYIGLTETKLHHRVLAQAKSGTTEPTNGTYYNTATNIITAHNAARDIQVSLPVGIVSFANGEIISIDQTFNGMGFIGSTVWVDKGVKGLIPDGRNEDGSLNNIEVVTDKIDILNLPDFMRGRQHAPLLLDSKGSIAPSLEVAAPYYDEVKNKSDIELTEYSLWYVLSENKCYQVNGTLQIYERPLVYIGYINVNDPLQINSLANKQPFRAMDYNDKPEISGWGMPSNTYILLTVGASGTDYTAPANGWVTLKGWSTTVGSYVAITYSTMVQQAMTHGAGYGISTIMPVRKGEKFTIGYNATDLSLRFNYAEGEV